MAVRIDREQNELRALKEVGDWHGLRVIDIGCGEGRLALRIARLGPRLIDALDPDREKIRAARQHVPGKYAKLIRYRVGTAEDLRYPDDTFDRAVFSWSL